MNKMYYIYLFLGERGKKYIGTTGNIERRLAEHARGLTYTTRRMGHLELVYYEAYKDRNAAWERERKLKKYGSSYHGLLKRLRI